MIPLKYTVIIHLFTSKSPNSEFWLPVGCILTRMKSRCVLTSCSPKFPFSLVKMIYTFYTCPVQPLVSMSLSVIYCGHLFPPSIGEILLWEIVHVFLCLDSWYALELHLRFITHLQLLDLMVPLTFGTKIANRDWRYLFLVDL